MRHQRLRGRLGVKTKHRKALLRNLVRNLVIHKRIKTTLAKAKAACSFADRMVELAKKGDLHSRRLLISRLGCPQTARLLVDQIAPHFKERHGGYTRVLHLSPWRVGDGSQMALLEFTAIMEAPEKSKKPKKAKREKEKESRPEVSTEKSKKEKETPVSEAAQEKEKKPAAPKKESEKKGGFLNALRKFLKGDEESH